MDSSLFIILYIYLIVFFRSCNFYIYLMEQIDHLTVPLKNETLKILNCFKLFTVKWLLTFNHGPLWLSDVSATLRHDLCLKPLARSLKIVQEKNGFQLNHFHIVNPSQFGNSIHFIWDDKMEVCLHFSFFRVKYAYFS